MLSVAAGLGERVTSEQSLQVPKSHPSPPHLSPVTEDLVWKRTRETGVMLLAAKHSCVAQ